MPHFKVSDESHAHPKVTMAGDAAWGFWTRAGCFSTHYGMDGFVPDWWVKQQPQGRAKAKKLVETELWHPGVYEGGRPEYQGLKGFNFHEWRQDSYAQVEADREKARRRKEAQRQRESRRDEQRDSSRTPGYTPNPLPPVVNSCGELTLDEPPRFCPDHPDGTNRKCGPCGDARVIHAAWTEKQQQNELAERRKARERRDSCTLCDEAGWVKNSDPAVKCDHQEQAHA